MGSYLNTVEIEAVYIYIVAFSYSARFVLRYRSFIIEEDGTAGYIAQVSLDYSSQFSQIDLKREITQNKAAGEKLLIRNPHVGHDEKLEQLYCQCATMCCTVRDSFQSHALATSQLW